MNRMNPKEEKEIKVQKLTKEMGQGREMRCQ